MTRVVFAVLRPDCARPDIYTMALGCRIRHTIYPDGCDRASTDFPYSGISFGYNRQQRLTLNTDRKEHCVAVGMQSKHVQLDRFGPEWRYCTGVVIKIL
jgi:hypothetical protein